MATACPSQRAATLQFTRTSSARSTSRRPASRSCAAGRSRSSIARGTRSRSSTLPPRSCSSAPTIQSAGGWVRADRGQQTWKWWGWPNAKYLSVREDPIPTVYLPFRDGSPMTLHVKTRADAQSALRVIEQEVKALDPALPLFQVQTIEARVDDALRQERLVATLATVLGVAAMLIAAVGIYGLISFSVAQRTREIGIRLAVGAEPRQILLMVLARVCLLVALGSAVGLPIALSSYRVAAAFLFGVGAGDPPIIASVLTVVTVVSMSAGLIPARNAARTDAWNALRSD